MTHPKARSKPRPRATRRSQDRITITAKGRALIAAYDLMRAGILAAEREREARAARVRQNLIDRNHADRLAAHAQQHEQGRATPCAPNRGNDAPATLPANDAGTAGAPPAHPAGKSDAAPLAKQPETDQ